ncbi:MAG: enolase C-terminal domain-like protein [Fermentimonas sp.]|jgi:L-alanine-DL-glutamate epimerase-like enolase superfamily enzyme
MVDLGRRQFIRKTALSLGGISLCESSFFGRGVRPSFSVNEGMSINKNSSSKYIRIDGVDSYFEREPLLSPFGFKGGYLSELWQSISYLKSDSGSHSIGLGTQSVLWSDAEIFSSYSESGGNALMYLLTEHALQMLKNTSLSSPVELIDDLFQEVYKYGVKITDNSSLRKTFALNALVSVDNALWLLYAKENNIHTFDDLIPNAYRSAFSQKHNDIAAIPLISYNVKPTDIRSEVDKGYFFMKIKIGQGGSQQEMLKKDMDRLSEIHSVLKDVHTPHTHSGKLPYYFDANGRYERKETFLRFLDHAEKIGAFDQIAIVEEPFPEQNEMDVTDIPVRLAADETAHTEKDTIARIDMGYKAIALKPIAKTLSMTMKIAKAASDRSIPCFCADLTVNPVLVEWNKNVAARLNPFPGLGQIGLLESNGHQNYVNWDAMEKRTPFYNEEWRKMNKGFYHTPASFYKHGGGIFDPIPHYEKLFNNK